MKRKEIVLIIALFLIYLSLYIVGTINENKKIQTFGFIGFGTTIGLVIGTLIRVRTKIINRKKYKIDLYILLTVSILGSFLMAFLFNDSDAKIVSIISFNVVMIIIFMVRNRKNISPRDIR